MGRAHWFGLIAVAAGTGFAAGYFLGALRTESRTYHRLFEREAQDIHKVLSSDPAFSRIEISESMDGEAHLRGEVETAADLERLRAALREAFGDSRSYLVREVQVRNPRI